jgi:hypothetical protein
MKKKKKKKREDKSSGRRRRRKSFSCYCAFVYQNALDTTTFGLGSQQRRMWKMQFHLQVGTKKIQGEGFARC